MLKVERLSELGDLSPIYLNSISIDGETEESCPHSIDDNPLNKTCDEKDVTRNAIDDEKVGDSIFMSPDSNVMSANARVPGTESQKSTLQYLKRESKSPQKLITHTEAKLRRVNRSRLGTELNKNLSTLQKEKSKESEFANKSVTPYAQQASSSLQYGGYSKHTDNSLDEFSSVDDFSPDDVDNEENEENYAHKLIDGRDGNNEGSGDDNGRRNIQALKTVEPRQITWLLKLGLREWRVLGIGIMALVITVASNLVIPALIGAMIDSALKDKSVTKLRNLVFIVLAFVVVNTIFTFIRAFSFNCAAEKVVARLRKDLFGKIMEQDIPFFDERKTGDLINRLSSDSKVLENTVTVNISNALRNSAQVLGCLIILFSISWKLSLVMLAVVPSFILVAACHGQMVKKLARMYQDALADSSNIAEESISNIRTVRSFAREHRQNQIYGRFIDISYSTARYLALSQGSFAASGVFLGNFALVVVIWLGGTLVLNEELSIGELTSFLMYTVYIAISVGMLSTLFYDLIKAVGATKNIFELLHRRPAFPSVSKEGEVYNNPPRILGDIRFSHVSFSYPSRPDVRVLNDFSLSIKKGFKIALVGESGAGKTTVGALLQRFYDVDLGEITIDNYNINAMSPEFLHQGIAVVHQEPVLFDCSIRENIMFGNPNATDFEIEEAARKANAYDFIMDFPDKFETIVGSRGHKCSGGQKQRIAIARAIISSAKILLLDESTSNLDSTNERIVQEALDNLMRESERTTILIAHRLSSVINADHIYVMKRGQIIEEGTHDELIQKHGYYHQLVQAQLLK